MRITYEELSCFEAIKIEEAWYWRKEERIYEAFISKEEVFLNDVTEILTCLR